MSRDTIRSIAQSPVEYRKHLIVPTSAHGPQPLGGIVAEFQRRDFEALDRAVIALVSGKRPEINRFWWERTKGGSKDSDLAIMVLWVIAFSPIGLTIQIAAADFEQASEMRKIMRQVLALNPWLAELVDVQATKIISKRPGGSECTILSADAASAHGARPDWLIINELSHVANEEFVQTLLDNAAKVPNGLICVATNAGHLGSWQWALRQTVVDNARWCFSALMEPAPWIDKGELEDRRRQTSPQRFARLWIGKWVAAEGDAFDAASIDIAIKPELAPMPRGIPGWAFGYGVDLGISRDHSAIVVVGRHGITGRFQLAAAEVFTPPLTGRVQIGDVEAALVKLRRQFGPGRIYLDPWQGEQLAQNLEKMRISVDRFTLNGAGWDRICRNTLELFNEGSIGLFPHPMLIEQLRATSVIEKTNGQLRFEWARSPQTGHGDVAMSFTLALLAARNSYVLSSPARRPLVVPPGMSFADLRMKNPAAFNQFIKK
ncbi:hypothetical protein K2Y11_22495 [bacterium]|nr:hypothetical protein [bacterium]